MSASQDVVCPACGATGNDECGTRSGKDHPSRTKAIVAAVRERDQT